jgi:hypothetical protein
LGKIRFEKFFSAEEANELIPRLEHLMREIQVAADALRRRVEELAAGEPELMALELPDLIARFPELRTHASRMAEAASQIESLGCFLKDIDQGLVDFPCDVGGEAVFLCWQFGEPHIVAWHPLDGGFAARKPLPGAAKPYLN